MGGTAINIANRTRGFSSPWPQISALSLAIGLTQDHRYRDTSIWLRRLL